MRFGLVILLSSGITYGFAQFGSATEYQVDMLTKLSIITVIFGVLYTGMDLLDGLDDWKNRRKERAE